MQDTRAARDFTLPEAVAACIDTESHVRAMLVHSMARRWARAVKGDRAAGTKRVLDAHGTVVTLTTLPRDEALRCVMRFAPWALYAAHVELGRLLALHRTVFGAS